MQSESQLLIISHDTVGQNMAGPGIRYYHMARVLAQHVPTTLAIPQEGATALPDYDFAVVGYTRGDWSTLAAQVQRASIVLLPSDIANEFPQIGASVAHLVIDGYDPLLAEWLALSGN